MSLWIQTNEFFSNPINNSDTLNSNTWTTEISLQSSGCQNLRLISLESLFKRRITTSTVSPFIIGISTSNRAEQGSTFRNIMAIPGYK